MRFWFLSTVTHLDAQTLELTGGGTGGAIVDRGEMTMNCLHTISNAVAVEWEVSDDGGTTWDRVATLTVGGACTVDTAYSSRVAATCPANGGSDGHTASFTQVSFTSENGQDFRCSVTDTTLTTTTSSHKVTAEIQGELRIIFQYSMLKAHI